MPITVIREVLQVPSEQLNLTVVRIDDFTSIILPTDLWDDSLTWNDSSTWAD